MVVAMSGVDGAGKSLQVSLLRDGLTADGIAHRVVWHRPGYSRWLDGLRSLFRQVRPSALPPPGPSVRRDMAFEREWVRRAWAGMALVDCAVQYGLLVRALSITRRHSVIVCDRYLHDGLIDLELRFADLGIARWWFTRAVKRIARGPDVAFLLLVPSEEQERRLVAKREPFPDSAAVRSRRIAAYAALASSDEVRCLDGARSPEAIAADILSTIRAGLGREAPRWR